MSQNLSSDFYLDAAMNYFQVLPGTEPACCQAHWWTSKTGFTNRLGRLKPRASVKMGGLITNNEDLFLVFTDF